MAHEDETAGPVADELGEGAVRHLEGPRAVVGHAEGGVTHRADHAAVGDQDDRAAGLGHGVQDGTHASEEDTAPLLAGETRALTPRERFQHVRVPLPDLCPCEPADLAHVVFGKSRVELDVYAEGGGDRFRRLGGTAQRTAYQAADRLAREVCGGCPRLAVPERRQPEIEASLDNAGGVTLGLTVTDEDETQEGVGLARHGAEAEVDIDGHANAGLAGGAAAELLDLDAFDSAG